MEGREDIGRLLGVSAIRGLTVGEGETASLKWELRRASLELVVVKTRDRTMLSDMKQAQCSNVENERMSKDLPQCAYRDSSCTP